MDARRMAASEDAPYGSSHKRRSAERSHAKAKRMSTVLPVLLGLTPLALGVVAAAWFVRRGLVATRPMSSDEAAHHTTHTGEVGWRFVGGLARGGVAEVHLPKQEVQRLLAERRWRELAPWLVLVAAVVAAWVCWPMMILLWVGVSWPFAVGIGATILAGLSHFIRRTLLN